MDWVKVTLSFNWSLRDCFSLHFMFRYERVYPEEVCCYDNTEDRVIVGVGDSCCATIPYSSSGAQVCCNGKYVAMTTQKIGVIVGVGDSCCAAIPYSSRGAQVSCNDGLETTAVQTEIYSKLIQCNVKTCSS